MLLSVRPVVLEVKWLYFISSIAFIYVNAFSYAKTFIVGDNRKKMTQGGASLEKINDNVLQVLFRELQPLFRRIRKVLVLPQMIARCQLMEGLTTLIAFTFGFKSLHTLSGNRKLQAYWQPSLQ